MQATETSEKVYRQVNLDVEQGLEWARKDYIDMTRAFDSVREMPCRDAKEYFCKFQALDGLCNVFDRLFANYGKLLDVDVYAGGEDTKDTGKPGWKECTMLLHLLSDVHDAREGMKSHPMWSNMLRATGSYIRRLPSEEIDVLSLEERHCDEDDLPPF